MLYPADVAGTDIQMLKDTLLEGGFSIWILAEQSEGLSGSDLKELCRNAAMRPMREFMRQADGDHEKLAQSQHEVCHPRGVVALFH